MGARVVVAMSGGVDSAVAAALLCREGHDVVGVLLRIWPSRRPAALEERFDSCCSPGAADDARAVAAALSIPFYVLNYEAEFDREVIRPFCDDYAAGRTPIPCLACNARLKFGSLLERARAWRAELVGTGHYARAGRDPRAGRFLLRRGLDARKDQSYFLYGLTQDQLARARFPVGGQTKEETRRIAADLGLPVAYKPESQEICFVPRDYREVVRERAAASLRPGPIRHVDGRTLGAHAGLADFTVGQRKGLGISAGRPLYVVGLDAASNTVTVGEDRHLWAREALLEGCNYIPWDAPPGPLRVRAKIRYAQPEAEATLIPLGAGRAALRFDEPQRAIAPGQAAVCYDHDDPGLVVGGGTIAAATGGEMAAPLAPALGAAAGGACGLHEGR
jgi:tRNA-uridine 2-sulfurtransferase